MNPVQYKQYMLKPKVQQPKSTQKQQRLLPDWNSNIKDDALYRLSPEEQQRRESARQPRPIGQEPIIGDQYITTSNNREQMIRYLSRADNVKKNTLTRAEYEEFKVEKQCYENPHLVTSNTGMVHEIPYSRESIENQKHQKLQQAQGSVTDQNFVASEDPQQQEIIAKQVILDHSQVLNRVASSTSGQRKSPQNDQQFGSVNEIVLQQFNKMSEVVGELQTLTKTLQSDVEILKSENGSLKSEVQKLKSELKVQKELNKAEEYVAMEDVLERLRFQ